MGFNQIEGQKRAVYLLAKSMAEGRLHHAYRFEGPAGTGKTMTAMAIAASLNCRDEVSVELESDFEEQPGGIEVKDFCGACRSCNKIPVGGDVEALNHPDVILITPQGLGRIIKIDQIRDLQPIITYGPVEGRARVIIIKEADNITEAASNAFLKILEEPPRDTYFFLTTSRPHKMLQTIRSRSTVIRFSPLSVDNVLDIAFV